MKNKSNVKKTIVFSLFALIFSGICCVGSILKSSNSTSPEQYPWTTNITIYNNTDQAYCRVWFQSNDVHSPLMAYIFDKDRLGTFERLKPGSTLTIEDGYLRYGFYNLWVQECGTTLWNKAASIVVTGKVCGPETVIQVGEPTGPSATQTVMAFSVEPVPTPLVTPQFTKQPDGFSGVYFHSSEDTQWERKNGDIQYIHTLLRFYEDGLVIGTYLDLDEVKGIEYVTSELSSELHHFNRYNALGKPSEYGTNLGWNPLFIAGTLQQRRLAYV